MHLPLDFFIILGLSLTLTYLIDAFSTNFGKHIPFRTVLPFTYLILSLVYVFIWNDLPFRLHEDTTPPGSREVNNTDGPNLGYAVHALFFYLLSILLNIIFWVMCIVICTRALLKKTPIRKDDILDDW